jgi:arabinogalactan endo-1,4-beta-galactosidase
VDQAKGIERCAGVFYWEPETDGTWRPEIYTLPAELYRYTGTPQTTPWNAYDQGAFTTNGAPTSILDCFSN